MQGGGRRPGRRLLRCADRAGHRPAGRGGRRQPVRPSVAGCCPALLPRRAQSAPDHPLPSFLPSLPRMTPARWPLSLRSFSSSSAEHFVFQFKPECHFFPNGTAGPGVVFLDRYFWGRQELVRFDSRRGSYEAVTQLGEPAARYWNSDKAFLERKRAEVDVFCRHNYGNIEPFAAARKMKPQLKITPTDSDPSSHHTLLVCTAASFFPAKISITWLRNGEEEDESRVVSTELIRTGDWTFRIQVMLEAQPERGDIYTCQVEHASLPGPTSIQWEPQSDSARSKMWTGVVGLLLGLVFVGPGLALYLKNKKGAAIPPPPALIG